MKCETCGRSTWTLVGEHRCPPAWEVWDSQNVGDDPKWPADFFWTDGLSSKVYANDAEEAVEHAHQIADASGVSARPVVFELLLMLRKTRDHLLGPGLSVRLPGDPEEGGDG